MSLSAMGTFEMRKMTISLTNLLLRIVWNSLIHIKLQSPSNTHSVVTEDTLWKHSSSRWSRLLKLRSLFQRERVNECSSPYCRIKFVDIWYTMKYIIFVSVNLKIAWRIRGLVKHTYIYLTSKRFFHFKENLVLPFIKTENMAFNSHILECYKVWKLLLAKLRDPILTKNPGKYDHNRDTLSCENMAFIRNHLNMNLNK